MEEVVFVAGGLPENSMEHYDAEENQWRAAALLSAHRYSFGMTMLRAEVYSVTRQMDPVTHFGKHETSKSQLRIDCP